MKWRVLDLYRSVADDASRCVSPTYDLGFEREAKDDRSSGLLPDLCTLVNIDPRHLLIPHSLPTYLGGNYSDMRGSVTRASTVFLDRMGNYVDTHRERYINDLGRTFRQGLPQVVLIATIRSHRLGKQ